MGKARYPGLKNTGNGPANSYGYFEQNFEPNEEQPTDSSYFMNHHEVQGQYAEHVPLSAEDHEHVEDYFGPHKKLQKISLKNGGYPVNGELEPTYN